MFACGRVSCSLTHSVIRRLHILASPGCNPNISCHGRQGPSEFHFEVSPEADKIRPEV
jgi:hypothetical protein